MVTMPALANSAILTTDGLPGWMRCYLHDNGSRRYAPGYLPTDADLIYEYVGCDDQPILITQTIPVQHAYGYCRGASIAAERQHAAVVDNLAASLPFELQGVRNENFAVLVVSPWRRHLTPIMGGFRP